MISTSIKPEVALKPGKQHPLAQLLHALNQPLTGLQCAMEVALAIPRSPEEYVRGLRQGLELTERMRMLVSAIQAVTESEVEPAQHGLGILSSGMVGAETMDFGKILGDAIRDFAPVAEAKGIHIILELSSSAAITMKMGKRQCQELVFRLLDSLLSLAGKGTDLRIATTVSADFSSLEVNWQLDGSKAESERETARIEPGLLVAQAWLEQAGAQWERERTRVFERLTIRFPGARTSARFPRANSPAIPAFSKRSLP